MLERVVMGQGAYCPLQQHSRDSPRFPVIGVSRSWPLLTRGSSGCYFDYSRWGGIYGVGWDGVRTCLTLAMVRPISSQSKIDTATTAAVVNPV